MTKLLACIALLFIGHWLGWVRAHYMVKTECEKLGKFFVGDTVFVCVKQEKEADKEQTK